MLRYLKSRAFAGLVGAAALAADAGGAGHRARQAADQDRFRHCRDRPARAERQVRAARDGNLGGGNQRQRRSAWPACAARPLRRSEQSVDGAGHLHQAARCRQSRCDRRRLRHQHAGAGDADRHAAQEDVPRPLRPRRQQRFQIRPLLRDDPVGAGAEDVVHQGLLRHRDGAESEADDGRDRGGRRGIFQECIGRRARERQEGRAEDRLRQELSAFDHRLLADRARDPGDQSRIWW